MVCVWMGEGGEVGEGRVVVVVGGNDVGVVIGRDVVGVKSRRCRRR